MATIKKPTLTKHAEIARKIHEAQDALLDVLIGNLFFYAREVDGVLSATRKLDALRSRMEDTMFECYPFLGREWIHLYYGDGSELARLTAEARRIDAERGLADEPWLTSEQIAALRKGR